MKIENVIEKQVELSFNKLPIFHQIGAKHGHTYIKLGEIKKSYNPNAFTEERRCQNKICRLLTPEKVIDKALLIDDNGYLWSVYLSNFKEITFINATI